MRHPGHARPRLASTRAWLPDAAIFAASCAYFACGISAREASLLESQDFGIACALFDTFALSPDHSPLHFIFVNLWQRLNAHSFAFVRAPSALACAAASVFVYRIAENEAGALAGMLCAGLFALNPLVVDNARCSRMYAWIVFFCAACLWCVYGYVFRARTRRSLIGFAVAGTLAFHTHLFSALWVLPLAGLLAYEVHRHRGDLDALRTARKVALVAAICWLPQVVHGVFALYFTHERHALYQGISGSTSGFLVPVVQTLLLGENWGGGPAHGLLLAPLALLAFGMLWGGRPARIAATAVLLPSLGVAWALSLSHEVEARYLNFLEPVLALLMGMGLLRARKPLLWVPLGPVVAVLFIYATQASYAGPRTDWDRAGARVESLVGPKDALAVFPGYWVSTFRRYLPRDASTIVPVTFPIDMQRLLDRGQRVYLVRNHGRYFGNISAFFRSRRVRVRRLFSTHVRAAFDVYAIEPQPPPPLLVEHPDAPSIVLTGMIGSGGYPWQAAPNARRYAFDRLRALFGSADVVVSGYEAYDPPWYQWLRFGTHGLRELAPNAAVLAAMHAGGINEVSLRCAGAACATTRRLLRAQGFGVLPNLGDQPVPRVREVSGPPIAAVFAGAPETTDLASLVQRVRREKHRLTQSERLVVVLDQHGDYGRTASASERTFAHRLIDAGADVVAGEGGYAAREVEPYKHGVIAYSLGTVLQPRTRSLSYSDSTGIALRVSFASDGVDFQVFETGFDDRFRPSLEPSSNLRHLVRTPSHPPRLSLTDKLPEADAGYADGAGGWRSLGSYRSERGLFVSPFNAWLDARIEPFARWFPRAPRRTPLRPFDGGYAAGGAYAGTRGVLGLGVYRRAIELDTGGHERIHLVFHALPRAQRLSIAYGVPDDRIASKYLPFAPETLSVSIAGRESLHEAVSYVAGFRTRLLALPQPSSPAQRIEISLLTPVTHFPLAIDPELVDPKVASAGP